MSFVSMAQTGTLVLSGLLPLGVGIMRMSNPTPAFGNMGIKVNPKDPTLLNEMRGQGSLMACAACITLSGAVFDEMKIMAHTAALLTFYGFLIGRIVSLMVDGSPDDRLKQGIVSEVVLGTANAVCLASILGK